jgi:Rrf2 family protein
MISQKTKYALKALAVLANEFRNDGASLRIEEIAQKSETPKRFLEHILLDLKRAGMIGSKRGRDGGYMLIKEPHKIAVSEVLRLVDGPIAPLACLSRRAYKRCDDCKNEETCMIRTVFGDVFAGYLLLIESITLADLMRNPKASVLSENITNLA